MFAAVAEPAVAVPVSGHDVCPSTLGKTLVELAVNDTVALRARPFWVMVTVGLALVTPPIADAWAENTLVATVFAWLVDWLISDGDTAASAAESAAALRRCCRAIAEA